MSATRVLALSLAFLVAGCAQPAAQDGGADSQDAPDGSLGGSGVGDGSVGDSGAGDGLAGGTAGSAGGSTGGSDPGSSDATAAGGTGVGYTVPRAVHEASWLCQTPVAVDDLTAGGTDGQHCQVTLSFTDTTVTVTATGIPNHDYESGGGCCSMARTVTKTLPLQPQMASAVSYAPERGSIALAVNGVDIYGPEDADDADVVIVTYTSSATPRLELCDGHNAPGQNAYHYHADANCIHWHAGAGEDWADYDFSKVDSTTHSGIVAWAPDGFPIYGTYGYDSDGSTIKEITSSYRLKSGATGSNGIADQEYIAGLGDLDECNGRTSNTPEFPDGIYHYYSTKHNGEGGFGFPYFPLCYKGVTTTTGGQMGGMQPTGGSTTTSSSMSGSMSGQPPPSGSGSSTSSSCPPPPPPGTSPTGPPPSGCPPPPPP